MILSHTFCLCHKLSFYVTEFLFMSNTLCLCHRLSVSVKDFTFLSQTFCFCHRFSVSVTDCLFLSKTFCISHRLSVSAADFLLILYKKQLKFFKKSIHMKISTGYSDNSFPEVWPRVRKVWVSTGLPGLQLHETGQLRGTGKTPEKSGPVWDTLNYLKKNWFDFFENTTIFCLQKKLRVISPKTWD